MIMTYAVLQELNPDCERYGSAGGSDAVCTNSLEEEI